MGHNNLLARESAVLLALDLIYEPYVWGGDNPDEGMDCSGFVGYWLKQLKVIPRRSIQRRRGITDISGSSRSI